MNIDHYHNQKKVEQEASEQHSRPGDWPGPLQQVRLLSTGYNCRDYSRLGSEMTTNARKWQSKCNELQKLLDEEIYLKDDLQGKIHVLEKKV